MQKLLSTLIVILTLSTSSLVNANPIDEGKMNYQMLCSSCHGELGHGDGIAGKALSEAPSNINDGLNSWFETEAELIDTVLNGNEGMPAWGSVLSEQQVKDIFVYIREINQAP
ncbi:cytochrome c [Vibrio kasasachensis]|uniref:c-type cytochrome n=1 Tax=Vibrio kasasachensis TaxID=2910248 RepID=UPI003D14FC56